MPKKTKEARIKELEEQLKLYENSLIELTKKNNELINAEENTFLHSPTYIQMQKRIEFLDNLSKLNETRAANLKKQALYMDDHVRQIFMDNQKIISENAGEYFVGITENRHKAEEYKKLRDDICMLEGEVYQLKIAVGDREEELERLRLELAAQKLEKVPPSGTEAIHNPKGAGRKKKGEAWQKSFGQFAQLFQDGRGREEIMEIMGISKATYYRYKKELHT